MATKDYPPKTNTEKEEIQKEIKRQEESQKAMIKALIGLASEEKINEMCKAAEIKREDLEDKKAEIKTKPEKTKTPAEKKLTTKKTEKAEGSSPSPEKKEPESKTNPEPQKPEDPFETAKKRVADSIDKKVGEELEKNKEPENNPPKEPPQQENPIPNPENPTDGQENSKYPFVWNAEKEETRNYYEGGYYIFDINGKETKISIFVNRIKFKPSLFKKIITLGLSKTGKKLVIEEKPSWDVVVYTENTDLYNKYPKNYEFNSQQEAIAFAEKIIDEEMKIKQEEESKDIPKPEDQNPQPENNGSKIIAEKRDAIEQRRLEELLKVEEPGIAQYQKGATITHPTDGRQFKLISDPVDYGSYYLIDAEILDGKNTSINLKLNKSTNKEQIDQINAKYDNELASLKDSQDTAENLVSMKEWNDFVDKNEVAEHTIDNIVEKIKSNKPLSEKEDKIRESRTQLIQEKLQSAEIKQQMQNAEENRIANISQSELLNRLDNLEENREEKLESSKFKGKIIRGLDVWEKFGQGEKGPKGFAKRMTKNAVNLALVGVISSFAVDQLAEAGIGSASALGGGVFSNVGRKMLMGLGFSSVLEGTNTLKIDKKYINGIKKAIPYMVTAGAITLGVASGAGLGVGAISAVSLIASKIWKGKFTKEKIEARQDKARSELLARIMAKGETINPKDAEKLEKELDKILKKYERQRIYGRVVDGIMKLGISSVVSSIALEASGMARDHLQHQEIKTESTTKEQTSDSTTTTKTDSTLIKTPTPGTTPEQQADSTATTQPADTTNTNHPTTPAVGNGEPQTQPETGSANQTHVEHTSVKELTDESSTKMAMKLGMYSPDATDGNESLTVQSGEVKFIDENNNEVKVEYNEKGAIQTMADLKQALHEKYGENIPEGKLTTHYVDMKGVEHDQTLVGTNASGETVIEQHHGDKFDSDHSEIKAEETTQTQESSNISEQQTNSTTVEPTDEQANLTDNQLNLQDQQTNPVTGKEMESNDNTSGENNEIGTKTEESNNTNPDQLPQAELEHVREVFNNNMEYLKGDIDNSVWNHVYKDIPAENLMEMYDNGELINDLKPLESVVYHMQRLEQVTDLHPYGIDLLNGHTEPESIPHFFDRALEEAQRRGVIDEVTL